MYGGACQKSGVQDLQLHEQGLPRPQEREGGAVRVSR